MRSTPGEPTDAPFVIPAQRTPEPPAPAKPDPASNFEHGVWLITGAPKPAKPVPKAKEGPDGECWMYGVLE